MSEWSESEFDYIAGDMAIHPSLERAAWCVLVDGQPRAKVRRDFRLGLAPMNRTLQRFNDRRAKLRCDRRSGAI